MQFSLDFPFAHGSPVGSAVFRSTPTDFVVDEHLGFEPEGQGEHAYLHVLKRGANTEWLAEQLARFAGVKVSDVGYSGLKDRHAETSQWFSVYLPGRDGPDWTSLTEHIDADLQLLGVSRGQRKLRRGQHLFNRFCIRLREVETVDEQLQLRLRAIKQQGVPNYFGEQRFGREGNNLALADDWLSGGRPIRARAQKNRAMSAARSYLFNLVVAARVRAGSWATPLPGDVLASEQVPTAPLWGRGRSASLEAAAEVERAALGDWAAWLDGLEHCGLSQERRSMVLLPANLQWSLHERTLELRFDLPPGQFATSVMREIFVLQNVSQSGSS